MISHVIDIIDVIAHFIKFNYSALHARSAWYNPGEPSFFFTARPGYTGPQPKHSAEAGAPVDGSRAPGVPGPPASP